MSGKPEVSARPGVPGSGHSWVEGATDAGNRARRLSNHQQKLSKIEETGLSAEKSLSNLLLMPSSILPNSEMRIEENLLGEDTLCMIQEDEDPARPQERRQSGDLRDEVFLPDQLQRDEDMAQQIVQLTDELSIEGYEAVKTVDGGPFGYLVLCRTKDQKYFYEKKGLALGWAQLSSLRQLASQGDPKLLMARQPICLSQQVNVRVAGNHRTSSCCNRTRDCANSKSQMRKRGSSRGEWLIDNLKELVFVENNEPMELQLVDCVT